MGSISSSPPHPENVETPKPPNSQLETLQIPDSELPTLKPPNSESQTPKSDPKSDLGALETPNPELETLNSETETLTLSEKPKEVIYDGWGEEFAPEPPKEEKDENFQYPLQPKEEKGHNFRHPLRRGKLDCANYVRTGDCRYGVNCKYNHPHDKLKSKVKKKNIVEAGEMSTDEKKKEAFSDGNGQRECKYYTTSMGCKYGKDCKFIHPQTSKEVSVELNFLGLPMRPGEKECSYYMSYGGCKYSTNCRYHHPDPTAVDQQDPLPQSRNGGSQQQHVQPAQMPMTSWSFQGNPNESAAFLDAPSSFVPSYYIPTHPNQQWNSYQAPTTPVAYPLSSNMNGTYQKANASASEPQVTEYPERPGRPECQFFMKTGNCKFKVACKYHHPKSRLSQTPRVDLNAMGLPLRPDQSTCTSYSRHGICKYGKSCRYNHPTESGPSAPPVAVNDFQDDGVQSQLVGNIGVNQGTEW